ncbi:WAT1-related protein At5g40240-like [Impatiens glandulifera]|uniref:WAT1-related protein At5g40240-like n=1 Tax=Impatiens glandulifera TaxID=253017 RepID=UPI001FB14FBC|nr:WAT1-related protein At5g40240-like [Impatiens glandulifera]
MLGSSWIAPLMVIVECMVAGSNTLSKVAMTQGMNDFVFVTYFDGLAFLFLLPTAFIYHRTKACPEITFPIVCRIFLLGIISCCFQLFLYFGIGYSSPTLASAMKCLGPAFTYILAVIFRMERVDWREKSSKVKLLGTIISITGAYIVTFYQGPPVLSSLIHFSSWILGGFLLVTATFFLSLEYIAQTWIIKVYPSETMVTLISAGFMTIISSVVALVMEGTSNAWKINSGMELIAIAYNAIFVVAVRTIVYTWACSMKGPVLVAMFKPLGIAFAALMGVAFLGDALHIGNIIGTGTIALGLYSVVKGKSMEAEEKSRIGSSTLPPLSHLIDNNDQVPFLVSRNNVQP